jgi:hypothetical protein
VIPSFHQQIFIAEVFIADDIGPQSFSPDLKPNPFEYRANVHNFGINDAQASQILRLADRHPKHLVVLVFWAIGLPEESQAVFIEATMDLVP